MRLPRTQHFWKRHFLPLTKQKTELCQQSVSELDLSAFEIVLCINIWSIHIHREFHTFTHIFKVAFVFFSLISVPLNFRTPAAWHREVLVLPAYDFCRFPFHLYAHREIRHTNGTKKRQLLVSFLYRAEFFLVQTAHITYICSLPWLKFTHV